MKILYCLHGTFSAGGMERIVVAKANAFAELGHEVVIATTEQHGRADYFSLASGVRRVDGDIMYSDSRTLNPLRKYFVRRRKIAAHRQFLSKLIEAEKPDVVISTFGNEVGFLFDIARGAKTIAEIHFSRHYRLLMRRKGFWRLIDHVLTATDRKAASRYDHFVTLTREDALNWGRMSNLTVIPNFVDAIPRTSAPLMARKAIAVGRLEPQKDYPAMLDVWKRVVERHPEWVLEIYGKGSERPRIERIITENNLASNVSLMGEVTPVPYLEATLMIHSSRYEGMSLAILEAMASGVPVVAYNCPGGMSELIDDNAVPREQKDKIVDNICKIIEEPQFRRQLAFRNFKRVLPYTRRRIIPRWLELFKA